MRHNVGRNEEHQMQPLDLIYSLVHLLKNCKYFQKDLSFSTLKLNFPLRLNEFHIAIMLGNRKQFYVSFNLEFVHVLVPLLTQISGNLHLNF